MGLQMDEIARKLFPKEPPARQTALLEECVLEEQKYLYDHGGTLYPGVVETLEQLHKKYPLYIVSNCQSGYIETFLHAHSLESYFDGFACYGDTKLSKGENNRLLIQRYGLQRPVYVGDTAGDQKSALDAGIPFVYAAYGFGQVAEYDAKIESFGALQNLFLNRI